ncbi:PTS-dependent dihydroxyacetone kinase phosphotransferase subunit DhaM [Collinsella sp. AGMB00827]|uniref:phosphoenolpyruvate--glycerone phosphotransferase n=1 Tax=Collinsella ureilytica TaxID=2869515 RepID=A0ABS7MLR0_9ACTN|nr:dihydroxyacetone kinase phosphoryl donor subunit DhaM [Collinsella urealyticum]MBY4798232.1 PTS-dependent dihydroxyacetone kinase phosphotransferase subunit DhaM [Collinsella urealyticum]
MVGIVLVSHSKALAEALVAYVATMAPEARVVAAGGLDDGSFGTSYDLIETAIEESLSDDGVVVLMDMGSAVMTVKMVLEDLEDKRVAMADCPFVEGAVEASVLAQSGASQAEILIALARIGETKKL